MEVCVATHLGFSTPEESGTVAHWLEGEVGPRTDLDALEKSKTPAFAGN
jgi:hypothetical protein